MVPKEGGARGKWPVASLTLWGTLEVVGGLPKGQLGAIERVVGA
ncbi:MAG TPA: hypothetical protein VGS80_06685 [Ktedonobacterales bacterium]|nr:hypothetical protein [Ktedonobacterales bacterium]